MRVYLAVDIGASSGRHICGWLEEGQWRTEEVYRFPNGVERKDGHLVWDMEALAGHVRIGVDKALERFPEIISLSVDTWGVDYVLLREGKALSPVYAYRDERTASVIDEVHEKLPFAELYRRTGCQFQSFNTLYQLYDDQKRGRLAQADQLMMIPEYLMYTLCGKVLREYTNATTTGMVNALTGEYDEEILAALGLPKGLFPKLSRPGTVIGEYKGLKVVLCATHDTASAVEGIPMEGSAPYISSGTWSLLGVKTEKPITDPASMAANYSNEGGVGYNRYQKNIMGMWIVNRLRSELCPDKPFGEIVAEAEQSAYTGVLNANDASLLAPDSMKDAFDALLPEKPQSVGDYFRCAFRSLAESYRVAIRELEANTGKTYDSLYIVGGGAKNALLNRMTQEATGLKVIALPIEATSFGNLKIQAEADHE